jgi:hypothetical protein
MNNKAFDEFNDKVVKEALKLIDVDEMAALMAKKIQAKTLEAFEEYTDNALDIGYFLQQELEDRQSKAGKVFQRALEGMAKRMASAI